MSMRKQYILTAPFGEMPTGSHITPTRGCFLNSDTRRRLESELTCLIDKETSIQVKRDWNGKIVGEYQICYTARGFLLIPVTHIREIP